MSTYVVIDLEMCCVQFKYRNYRHKHEIVQIGAVMMNESFEILGKFSTFVRPEFGKIDYFISSLTGIKDKDVRHAPSLIEALRSMVLWMGERDVRFYAWSHTDYKQLRNEIVDKALGKEEFALFLDEENWIDYQKVVSERFKIGRALSLSDALTVMDLEPEGRLHDGLDDAWNTARVIMKLEQEPHFDFPLDKLRKEEEKSEPLMTSMAGLLRGIVLEPA